MIPVLHHTTQRGLTSFDRMCTNASLIVSLPTRTCALIFEILQGTNGWRTIEKPRICLDPMHSGAGGAVEAKDDQAMDVHHAIVLHIPSRHGAHELALCLHRQTRVDTSNSEVSYKQSGFNS